MNRRRAKLLTVAGGFCCFAAVVLFAVNFYKEIVFPQSFLFFPFVVGIILITISLAYYTEK